MTTYKIYDIYKYCNTVLWQYNIYLSQYSPTPSEASLVIKLEALAPLEGMW